VAQNLTDGEVVKKNGNNGAKCSRYTFSAKKKHLIKSFHVVEEKGAPNTKPVWHVKGRDNHKVPHPRGLQSGAPEMLVVTFVEKQSKPAMVATYLTSTLAVESLSRRCMSRHTSTFWRSNIPGQQRPLSFW